VLRVSIVKVLDETPKLQLTPDMTELEFTLGTFVSEGRARPNAAVAGSMPQAQLMGLLHCDLLWDTSIYGMVPRTSTLNTRFPTSASCTKVVT
jgi:hypothetical protein